MTEYVPPYSGAKVIAINRCPHEIPEDIEGGDLECWNWWAAFRTGENSANIIFGFGETFEEALRDIRSKLALR